MKTLTLLLALLMAPASSLAQGTFAPPQTAFKNINGILMPIANATITVCAANAGGIPCTPALINTIFKDSGLTQPLSNPFTADANGNYQFAAAAATYTITVTAAGFAGYSYQASLGGSGGSTPGGPSGAVQINNAGALGGVSLGNDQLLVGTAGNPAAQSKPVIDVRGKGVDCTGATNSDSALTFLATQDSITSSQLQFPDGCKIHVQNTILVKNQASFSFLGVSRVGAAGKGVTITCVSGGSCTGGPLLDMEYVDGFEIGDIMLDANGLASASLNIDKNGAGAAYNTTDGRIHDMAFHVKATGGGTQSWTGVQISNVSTQNVEDIRVTDSAFFCNARPGNFAQYGVQIGASQNAKNEVVRHNNFTNCFDAVYSHQGSVLIEENEFTASGGACASGTGADIRVDGNTDPDIIRHNLDENGTQFFNCNNDADLGGCNNSFAISITGNHFSPAGCENTSNYWINASNSSGPMEIRNNGWDQDAGLVNVIGTSHPSIVRPLNVGGNIYPNQTYTPFWLQAPGAASGIGSTLDDQAMFTGSKLFAGAAVGQAFPSPAVVFRAYQNSTTFDDYGIQNVIGQNSSTTLLFKHQQGAAGNAVAIEGTMAGITLAQVPTPSSGPTIVNQGSAGSTSYTYAFVPYFNSATCTGNSNAPPSPTATTATGNATLTSINYNELHFLGTPGATSYGVWRTASAGTPSSTGKIACLSALQSYGEPYPWGSAYSANQVLVNNNYVLLDTGLAGDSSSLPSGNFTGAFAPATVLFANLPGSPNGTIFYCSDCKNVTDDTTGTFDSAAAGGGHGTIVLRENGAWRVH